MERFSIMEKQRNGEAGPLLTDGYANIFYIEDVSGDLRAVCPTVYCFTAATSKTACLILCTQPVT
jgi:hypothetical protein